MTTTTPAAPAARAAAQVLRYNQQVDELMHAARLYQRSTRKHQIYKGLGALVLFLGAWMLLTSGVGLGPVLLMVLGAFLWLDPVPLLVLWFGYRNGVGVKDPYETVIDERGTHFTIGKSRVSRPWDKYTGLLESDRVFVLIFGRWAYTVIPKRALADDTQTAALRALLRGKIQR